MYWHEPVRVAVSLRVVEHEGYPERRDALAQDWATCLQRWNVLPLLVPNRWRDPVQLVRQWGAQALLLTGGNDIAATGSHRDVAPERDRTETSLLEWAETTNVPVLGVCRGAQMLNLHCGGHLQRMDPAHQDERRTHRVRFAPHWGLPELAVNSFHEWGIRAEGLSRMLEPQAIAEDGAIEAFQHRGRPWLGMMWHPERSEPGPPEFLERLGAFLRDGAPALAGWEEVGAR